jgi:hypothetical protein
MGGFEMASRAEIVRSRYDLDSTDREMLKMIVKHPTISRIELSHLFDINRRTVAKRMERPAFQAALAELTGTVDEDLQKGIREGVSKMRQLIAGTNAQAATNAFKALAMLYLGRNPTERMKDAVRIYRTTVKPDGSLVQEIVEAGVEDMTGAVQSDMMEAELGDAG